MRYNTSLKGADNCFFPAFEPRVIVLWCRISLHVEGLLWSWVQSRRHRVRLNLFLLIRSPVPSLPTWVLCRKHMIVFYLVPLFSRFSHFPFGTFVALETQRERSQFNLIQTAKWFLVLRQTAQVFNRPSCQEGQGVQASQVDTSLDTKRQQQKIELRI